jgi:hypothetical protein
LEAFVAITWSPIAKTGLEGSSISLGLIAGYGSSLTVSGIPVGAVLADGHGHSFIATPGTTSVSLIGWTLTSLTITPVNDQNFVLTAIGATGSVTEIVTVNPLAPTVAPVAEVGVEGQKIALNLGATINSLAGDSNTLSSLIVSAIPVGAKLSDGTHTFTATASTTSVNISAWTLSSLTVTPTNDTNFTLSVAATTKDAEGNLSSTTSATELVTVNPLAPTVTPVAEVGVEGQAIALNLRLTINKLSGDTNTLASLIVSAIPVGATLSDGTHSFTAATGSTSVDVSTWTLSSLTIKSVTDANFTLSVAATTKDAEGNLSSTTSASELVTVNPLAPTVAPVAEVGVEGQKIALNLGLTINKLTGDTNTLASLVVSAIPIGATLSDGTHTFTAATGSRSVDVSTWTLSSLTITPTNDANFTLSVAATTKDAESNLSSTMSATELVTVHPLAPTLAPVAVSGVENAAIALNLGLTINKLTGDTNTLASLIVSAIPIGATLSDGTHTFTAATGSTSVDVSTWTLARLKITPTTDANFILSVAATTKDAQGVLSTTTPSTELVTVNPLAPTVVWAAAPAAGVEGSPISLGAISDTVRGSTGDTNTLASLIASAIPVGATLSDGTHSFTAATGNTSVDVSTWTLSSLTIKSVTDANFTLSVAATTKDAEGNLSVSASATEKVTVNPMAPTVTWAAAHGAFTAGSPVALGAISYSINGSVSDSNQLSSLVVHGIPVGATLSDGTNIFVATAGHTSVDVSTWALTNLSLSPTTSNNFTLSVSAVVRDSEGNLSTTATASESEITTSGTVTASSTSLNVASANLNVTLVGNNDSVNVAAASDTIVLQGTNDAVAFSASGSLNLTASQTSLSITGNNDVVSVIGNGNAITFSANNTALNLTDPNDTINLTGSSDTIGLVARGDTVNLSGSNDVVTITGSGNTVVASGANDTLNLAGAYDVATLSNGTINVTSTGSSNGTQAQTDVTLTANNAQVNMIGGGHAITMSGDNNVIDMTYAMYDTMYLSGTGDSITLGNWTGVTLQGDNEALTVSTAGSITGATVTVAGANDVVTVNGQLGAPWGVVVGGANDSVTVNGSSPVYLTPDNTSVSLTASGDAVSLTGSNTILTLNGTNDSVTLEGANDSALLTGSTGSISIGNGSTLELTTGASSSQTVTFAGATGVLKLDNAQNFHGVVSGLTTLDGTLANSDQIDLANINHQSSSFNALFDSVHDTLTVTDGTNTAVIQLTGSYSSNNFNFVDDGNQINGVSGTSGTIVYDPPVQASQLAQAASGTNAGVAGSAAIDVFVFAPTSTGPAVQHTITDFVVGLDKIDLRQFSAISASALPTETQQGNDTLITLDSHDTLLLKNVHATLHAGDFIVHA